MQTLAIAVIVAVTIGLSTPTIASAAAATATLASTINTGSGSNAWSPDSPDPSGLAYVPSTDRLVAADGEVEETTGAGFHGANVWFATRDGASTSTLNTRTASPSNNEPVGAAYDAVRDELYISKDGANSRIWVYDATTHAQLRSFAVSGPPYNNADAEGLGFGSGVLYMTDAADNDLVRVEPGQNGVVGTGGDDVVTNYDLQRHGQTEPEGVDVHPETGNVWVVSNTSPPQPMIEVTPSGVLVSSVSIAAIGALAPAGLAIAPPSDGSPGYNFYIADRGIDNQQDPDENDGRIYEVTLDQTPPGGTEHLLNGGFELDAGGDTRPDNWTANAAFTRSSDEVHAGSFAGRHASSSNPSYSVYQAVADITGGTSYAFDGWLSIPQTSDAFTFKIQLKWRNASGAISTTTVYKRTTSTAGWVHMSGEATAPAGATSARVTMNVKSLDGTIYVDDFTLFG